MVTRRLKTVVFVCLLVLATACGGSSPSTPASSEPSLPLPELVVNIDVTVVNNSGVKLCWIYFVEPGADDFENILYNTNYLDTNASAVIKGVKMGIYDVHGLTCDFNDVAVGTSLLISKTNNMVTFPPLDVIPEVDPLIDLNSGFLKIVNNTQKNICDIGLTKPGDFTVILATYTWADNNPIGPGEYGTAEGIKPRTYDISVFDCLGYLLTHVYDMVIVKGANTLTLNQ